MREKRQSLSRSDQIIASNRLCESIIFLLGRLASKKVGAYISNDGEIDPMPAIHTLVYRGHQGFLPVIFGTKRPRLRFAKYSAKGPMVVGKFGIPVPLHKKSSLINPHELDWLLMPLVAFDNSGNRLGMGGGFYDSSLAAICQRKNWRRPKLIGMAFEFQRVEKIEADNWDIPLDGILTDSEFRPINSELSKIKSVR